MSVYFRPQTWCDSTCLDCKPTVECGLGRLASASTNSPTNIRTTHYFFDKCNFSILIAKSVFLKKLKHISVKALPALIKLLLDERLTARTVAARLACKLIMQFCINWKMQMFANQHYILPRRNESLGLQAWHFSAMFTLRKSIGVKSRTILFTYKMSGTIR